MVFEPHKEFVSRHIVQAGLQYNALGPITSSAEELSRSLPKGWQLKRHSTNKRRYTVTDKEGVARGEVSGTKLGQHPAVIDHLINDKQQTKMVLQLAGVPVPLGFTVPSTQPKIGEYLFEKLPAPVVVKPLDGAVSRGVTVNVTDLGTFRSAWKQASENNVGEPRVMLEEQLIGFDLRTYVVGGRCVAAATRMQPFVVGDGRSDIAELLKADREKRKVNAQLSAAEVYIDDAFLGMQGYANKSVPALGEVVFLNTLPVVGKGAVTVEVSPLVCSALTDLAVDAVRSFPKLEVAAVDLLVESLDSAQGARVLEINTRPALTMHTFPSMGAPTKPTDSVCDHYRWVD
ncbi:hypothetical protein [Corynebacterium sp. CQ3829_602738]